MSTSDDINHATYSDGVEPLAVLGDLHHLLLLLVLAEVPVEVGAVAGVLGHGEAGGASVFGRAFISCCGP